MQNQYYLTKVYAPMPLKKATPNSMMRRCVTVISAAKAMTVHRLHRSAPQANGSNMEPKIAIAVSSTNK